MYKISVYKIENPESMDASRLKWVLIDEVYCKYESDVDYFCANEYLDYTGIRHRFAVEETDNLDTDEVNLYEPPCDENYNREGDFYY